MQIPVNKDLDSYKDDFFKGLTLKQTALSIISVAAGTGTYLAASYGLKLDQSVSFYLALPGCAADRGIRLPADPRDDAVGVPEAEADDTEQGDLLLRAGGAASGGRERQPCGKGKGILAAR